MRRWYCTVRGTLVAPNRWRVVPLGWWLRSHWPETPLSRQLWHQSTPPRVSSFHSSAHTSVRHVPCTQSSMFCENDISGMQPDSREVWDKTDNNLQTNYIMIWTFSSPDRFVHEHLPWLGVRQGCYVTLANNPEYFWVQFKSAHLTDLETIMVDIQSTCQVCFFFPLLPFFFQVHYIWLVLR